jgi:hypothetical protein
MEIISTILTYSTIIITIIHTMINAIHTMHRLPGPHVEGLRMTGININLDRRYFTDIIIMIIKTKGRISRTLI